MTPSWIPIISRMRPRLPGPTTASTPCTPTTITTMIDRHVNLSSGCRISSSACTLCSCLFIATTWNAAVDLLIPYTSSPYPSSLRLPSSPPFPSCGPSRLASPLQPLSLHDLHSSLTLHTTNNQKG
ncbi:hypothetical protein GALMADRAFT_232931 [Galerina marginata CBS 339.88]|uniref:Uncharacterized protein n=1 Tax=Galerina marginata (strain CBS 339.88) TaxID=685588 RepID=A0A067SCH5_GALM3|nr:hypothetical protein GALMADRAFT_232931 [Galerina marginata CBS 339.88]